MKWLHVINNTGNILRITWNAGNHPIEVLPGKWCFASGAPHCNPRTP